MAFKNYNRFGVYIYKLWEKYRGREEIMKKKIIAMLLTGVIVLSITACDGNTDSEKDNKANAETTTKQEEPEADVTYQSILDDYTKKIADATPGLVEEYNNEAAPIAGDLNALAELSNSKVGKLAEISNQGVSEMATLMQKNGDEYSVYEEWSLKLTDVYTQYATQITDAYTASAAGMSTEDIMNSLNSLGE